MKTVIIYETNLDYQASYDKLVDSDIVIADVTQKGILSVRFKGFRTVFMISPKGKIQVFWKSLEEKAILLDKLENLLVGRDGKKIWIKPLKQTQTIPYADEFVLFWCAKGIRYVRKRLSYSSFVAAISTLFFFVIYLIAEQDYSLVLLNQTILNPLRSITTPIPFLALAMVCLLFFVRDLKKSRNIEKTV